jgi:hypothetical protein
MSRPLADSPGRGHPRRIETWRTWRKGWGPVIAVALIVAAFAFSYTEHPLWVQTINALIGASVVLVGYFVVEKVKARSRG